MDLGLYQKSADEFRLGLAVIPDIASENLAFVLQAQGQYDQAEALMQRFQDSKLQDSAGNHDRRYELALLRSDAAGLDRERAWMAKNTDDPSVIGMQAGTDLSAGNLSQARQRTLHAALYYREVTGEIYKAIDALRSWEGLEPGAFPPHNRLGLAYSAVRADLKVQALRCLIHYGSKAGMLRAVHDQVSQRP